MIERADETPAAIHLEISSGPRNRRTYVAGKNRVVISQFADNPTHVLRVDQFAIGTALGKGVEICACLPIVGEGFIKMRGVRLFIDERKERFERIPHGSDNAEVERTAITESISSNIDLGDARILGKELPVRKIRPEH